MCSEVLFLCKSTLHVSGGTHAHHQEYNLNCINSHWYNSAGFVVPDGCISSIQFSLGVFKLVYCSCLFGLYVLYIYCSVHRNILWNNQLMSHRDDLGPTMNDTNGC